MNHLEAAGWGVLSGSSFPVGCLVGLVRSPLSYLWCDLSEPNRAGPVGQRLRKVPLWVRGVLMGFGGGVMLSDLTVSLFAQWLHRPQEFGRGATSILLVSAIIGTTTAHGTRLTTAQSQDTTTDG